MMHSGKLFSKGVSYIPITTAFDFETAFPSVIHGWMWAVLRHRRLPESFLRLFVGLYNKASAIYNNNGQILTLILFLSGVLQGCPGSAFLFNNSLDPFLHLMDRFLRGARAGIVRACADDIGLTLRRLSHLKKIHPIFMNAQRLGGLTLKPAKCIIVPLCELSNEIRNSIMAWLEANIPEWVGFAVEPTTKLLGFYIGPKMGSKNWVGPITKYKSRVAAIRSNDASLSLNAYTYNVKVIPVSSYQEQPLSLTKEYSMLERVAMHTILRLPFNALRHADFFQLHIVCKIRLRSLSAACASTLFTTAYKTITSWPQWVNRLDVAAR